MVSYCTGSKFGKVREGERDIQNAVQMKKASNHGLLAGKVCIFAVGCSL